MWGGLGVLIVRACVCVCGGGGARGADCEGVCVYV